MIEHIFVGELMRQAWLRHWRDFDLLRPVTDAAGYDIVMSAGGSTRHIQLKSSALGATTAKQNINLALTRQAAGCVVWIWFDPNNIKLDHFLWIGGNQHEKIPDLGSRIAKHTKADASGVKKERVNLRTVPKGRFKKILSISDLFDHLFIGVV
ncbi:MAG: hypothetical protein WA790_00430 [Sulfitobacter sp.]